MYSQLVSAKNEYWLRQTRFGIQQGKLSNPYSVYWNQAENGQIKNVHCYLLWMPFSSVHLI